MQTITVETRYGYFKNAQGRIVSKAELPPGAHPMKDGFTYTEVLDADALEPIQIYIDPATIEQIQNEQKIADHIRQKAIAELKVSGDLPADYIDS